MVVGHVGGRATHVNVVHFSCCFCDTRTGFDAQCTPPVCLRRCKNDALMTHCRRDNCAHTHGSCFEPTFSALYFATFQLLVEELCVSICRQLYAVSVLTYAKNAFTYGCERIESSAQTLSASRGHRWNVLPTHGVGGAEQHLP
jgi:hypothetical protein